MPIVKAQAAAPNVVLKPPAPIPQPSIASYSIIRSIVDLSQGSETLVVVALDANGARIGDLVTVQVPSPTAATTITQFTPQLYADLQTALGIVGTVQ